MHGIVFKPAEFLVHPKSKSNPPYLRLPKKIVGLLGNLKFKTSGA